MKQTLKLIDYIVDCSLGCSKEEQSKLQPVSFNIRLEFSWPVLGSQSDQLGDTIDYAMMTKIIHVVCKQKSYNLIEHLCFNVTAALVDKLRNLGLRGVLSVSAVKLNVPIANLKGGAEFICEETL